MELRPALVDLARRQGGVFTRPQALLYGYSEAEIRAHAGPRGAWSRLRTGVYAARDLWESTHGRRDVRLGLLDRAGHLATRSPHLMSHDSAARVWELPTLRPHEDLVHVTTLGTGTARTRHGVMHHRSRTCLLNTIVVDTMRVTSLARTAVDLARRHGFAAGLVACDGALARGVSRADLGAEFAAMWCWPGSRDVRDAIELADAGADNPGETLARLMLLEGELVPQTQFPVRIANGTAWVDLRVGRHLIEMDGRLKYLPRAAGGVLDTSPEDALWRERQRQLHVCEQGFGMSRVGWDDLITPQRRAQTLQRVLREMRVTHDRFGPLLTPEMAAFAEAMQGQREQRIRRRTAV